MVARSEGDEDGGPRADAGFRRAHVSLLPASGAWREGDPVGARRFLRFDRPFALEGGGVLPEVTLAYETWGTLAPDGSNAILVCHALTGDSHAVGPLEPGHPTAGWWNGLVGPGQAVDTDRWFVVCANVLGGCQGTTGPASAHPDDGPAVGEPLPGGVGAGLGAQPGHPRRPPRRRAAGTA